jgi:hypothetical protein
MSDRTPPSRERAAVRRDLPKAPDGCRYFRDEWGEWWIVSPEYGHHSLAGWIWWRHGFDVDRLVAA